MNHKPSTLRSLAFGLAIVLLAAAAVSSLAETNSSDERKAKILANLVLQFPQLEQLGATVDEIKASGYEGLDEGTFSFRGQRGQQSQTFFVTSDDTKLYMVSGEPIDVSRSADEIQAELAKRAEEAAKEAAERVTKLQESIEGLPFRGKADAPVTIVEFSDFQCPYCARGASTMEQILEKYGDDVKFVFKHFPLGFHPWAKPAAIASHCAGLQNHDAFWTLHDKYFADQKSLNPENVLTKSKEYLASSGIDLEKWSECAEKTESDAYKAAAAAIDGDMAFGTQLGVSGTPGFFVNGEFLNGAQPINAFEPLIEKAKNSAMGS
ncbi:MAG: thioredoxin domain-containing protein [Acidobacteria bacterium]|nr:thioredoxin domain-containing protein [Acidobacteriota bacterium]